MKLIKLMHDYCGLLFAKFKNAVMDISKSIHYQIPYFLGGGSFTCSVMYVPLARSLDFENHNYNPHKSPSMFK